MNKRFILIAVIAVIIIAVIGAFTFTQHPTQQNDKVNTEITFLSSENLKNGDAVEFILKDEQENILTNQNITIIFVEDGENQTYSIITDSYGEGSLVLNNEAPGSYDVIVSYNGTLTYNGCSAKQTITIEEGSSQSSSDSDSKTNQSNSTAGTALYNGNSSDSQLYYDNQYNFYYDNNGIIRGGQNDGYSADYIRNIYDSGDMIDEDGNLQ